jgi:hypothetical protein
VDIAFGFKHDSLVAKYGRDRVAALPNWMTYSQLVIAQTCTFAPGLTESVTAAAWRKRKHHGVFLANKEVWPRRLLVKAAAASGHVLCPGAAFNNADLATLLPKGTPLMANGAKLLLLQQTRFSICPENSHGEGYWTEKLFQAHVAGAVPVYWGSAPAQPHVLNPARILQWDADADPDATALAARIEELASSADAQREFFAHPLLEPGAGRWLQDRCIDVARVFEAGMRAKLGHLLKKAGIRVRPVVPKPDQHV